MLVITKKDLSLQLATLLEKDFLFKKTELDNIVNAYFSIIKNIIVIDGKFSFRGMFSLRVKEKKSQLLSKHLRGITKDRTEDHKILKCEVQHQFAMRLRLQEKDSLEECCNPNHAYSIKLNKLMYEYLNEEFRGTRSQSELTKKLASNIVTCLTGLVKYHILTNQTILIRGFGTLVTKLKKSRCCVNPRNMEKFDIPERYVFQFKCHEDLYELINQNTAN